jgi:hypothetical protein
MELANQVEPVGLVITTSPDGTTKTVDEALIEEKRLRRQKAGL